MPEEPQPQENTAPAKNKGGRPIKLSKELIEKALKAAKLNISDANLCRYCRIHPETLINWRHRARIGEKKFLEFFEKLDEARAEGLMHSAKIIHDSTDWRAHAYMLDRGDGKTAVPVTLSGGGKDSEPIKVDTGIMPPVYVILQNVEGVPNPYQQPEATPTEPGK